MSNNITYLQNVVALSASEGAATKQEVGKRNVQQASTQRKELQNKIREMQAEAERLAAELEEASDMNAWDKICAFFGDDQGRAELARDMKINAAEQKKAANELKIAQVEIEQALQELNSAQQELGGRVSERQKAYDETQKANDTAMF